MTSTRRTLPALAALLLLGAACSGKNTETIKTVIEIPACSASYPTGTCDAGSTCFQGACVASGSLCSPTNLSGTCASGLVCYGGGCVLPSVVPPTEPVLDCTANVYTTQPTLAVSPAKPLGTAGAAYTYNNGTATVEVPYVQKAIITVGGLQFRDLNGNGTLDLYEDWRKPEICRAQDLVVQMTARQKIGLMSEGGTFGTGSTDGVLTASTIQSLAFDQRRQALFRLANFNANQIAAYINNLQAMSEGLPLGIPVVITADPVHGFGMNVDGTTGAQTLGAPTVVSPWPYPMGLGAANDAALTLAYGNAVRREFMAMGFRWQLGPMADLATEPRWARVQNTFGDNAYAVSKHTAACIKGFQGSDTGNLKNGIAATMKHFPGAGPDNDGTDSHTYLGKWNVYPGNMFTYHQISFKAAIAAGAAAVMPCYSIMKDQMEYSPEQTGNAFSKTMITKYLKSELGFTGMVTSDWGTMSGAAHGVEALTQPERAAMFVKAGSHQLGNDSHTIVQAAYDQGLLVDSDIDGAAVKILEMTFKLGLFENPYVNAASTEVRSAANLKEGFDAQKKAMVVLRGGGTGATRIIPISATRYADKAGGTTGAPDVGEFSSDYNGNGTVEVYYDGVNNGLTGTDIYSTGANLGDYDYTSAGSGTAGTAGFTLPVATAATAATADIAVVRISARKGNYSGLDAGVPLSFDKPFPGYSTDTGLPPAIKDRNRVIDLFRIRDGYKDSTGAAIAATNSKLKIVVVMHMDRPGIVKPFINGLTTLDETAGVPGSYPLVSNQVNVNQQIVTTTTATAHAGVDGFLVDFGAYDRAVLDVLFSRNVISGWSYGQARLPVEIPATDADVEAQFEDVPADSWAPTYAAGSGSNMATN